MAHLTSLAGHNSISQVHIEALREEKDYQFQPFSAAASLFWWPPNWGQYTHHSGHLCYLKSPLTMERGLLPPGSQNLRTGQVCCWSVIPCEQVLSLWKKMIYKYVSVQHLSATQTNTNNCYKVTWVRITNILHHLFSLRIVKEWLLLPLPTSFKWFNSIGLVHRTLHFEL